MRVIFLDIDGVLNSAETFKIDHENRGTPECKGCCGKLFSKEAVETLKYILDYSKDIQIVISSTWRLHEWRETYDVFLDNGINIGSRWHDITPVVYNYTDRPDSEVRRGLEIQKWLDDNEDDNITDFVIIDDDSDMAHLMDHLVKTQWETGLLKKHIPMILEKLGFKQ